LTDFTPGQLMRIIGDAIRAREFEVAAAALKLLAIADPVQAEAVYAVLVSFGGDSRD